MAEFTSIATQTVAANGNVLFTETPICSGYVDHRKGSGIVTLKRDPRGRARYKVSFGANIAVATGGTAGSISLALAIDGEALASATAISTPAAVGEFNSVFAAVYIDVPCSCCKSVSVRNTGATAVDVANANLIVERVA